jgi:hypothetical protein
LRVASKAAPQLIPMNKPTTSKKYGGSVGK